MSPTVNIPAAEAYTHAPRPFVCWLVLLSVAPVFAHEHTQPNTSPAPLGADNQPSEAVDATVRLIDDATGKAIPGCIRVRTKKPDSETAWLSLPPLLHRGTGLSNRKAQSGWHVVPEGKATMAVPKGPWVIEAISGVEYTFESLETNAADTEVRLKRLSAPSIDGWVAGNTHLHLMRLTREMADRYLLEVSRGVKNELDEPLFAHTSPIYVMIDGRGVYHSKTAAEIAAEMKQSIKQITKHGVFANENQRRGILQLYRSAISQITSVGEEL